MRLTIYTILLFLLALAVTLVLSFPVQLLVDLGQDYVPEDITLQSSTGSVTKGSVLVMSPLLTKPLRVSWKMCVIDWLHPLGVCVSTNIKGVDAHLAVQPWTLGETISLFNIVVKTTLPNLAELHPSLATLAVVNGNFASDIQRLTFNLKDVRIHDIVGDIQLTQVKALGLQLGTVNVALTSELIGEDVAQSTIIVVEGGNIDRINIQGSGNIKPDGQLSMRFLLRSNNKSMQQQLGVFAKKQSDTEFEWKYANKIF